MNRSPKKVAAVLGIVVCVSAACLAWFGYLAILKWRQSSTLLAERRAHEAADRFAVALARDMQGAQRSVLLTADSREFARDLPYSSVPLAASAFARFPYLESVFAWDGQKDTLPVFFNRRDRLPPWISSDVGPNRFPVIVGSDATIADQILHQIRLDGKEGQPFSVFEKRLGGVRYQVVARLVYEDALRQSLQQAIGFTVNLEWVRRHYFNDLIKQLQKIEGVDGDVTLTVTDDQGTLVAGTFGPTPGSPVSHRMFSLMFFDPLLAISKVPADSTRIFWSIEATTSSDSQLAAALGGASRLLGLSILACGTLVFGLVLAARAARAGVELAALRSEFVSSVSHELKAPLATIRAAGDSLVAGRVIKEADRRDYARLMVQEAKRLTRLVDNLLAFSRLTDVTTAYSFEPFAIDVLVETALQRLHVQLVNSGFSVAVDVPNDLPPILADRDATLLMLENLLDNAIRYSGDSRRLEIVGRASVSKVMLDVRDYGRGIPPEEIKHVTKRFYRARNADSNGTGLGLAIAKRIAIDHGGSLKIQSVLRIGTTITVILPAMPHEEPIEEAW